MPVTQSSADRKNEEGKRERGKWSRPIENFQAFASYPLDRVEVVAKSGSMTRVHTCKNEKKSNRGQSIIVDHRQLVKIIHGCHKGKYPVSPVKNMTEDLYPIARTGERGSIGYCLLSNSVVVNLAFMTPGNQKLNNQISKEKQTAKRRCVQIRTRDPWNR
ncbi:uncharacterized protein BDR25DRAFT_360397 [Lindgomyces ingoldianus]|uniref:Uncharacterized protein n=1 Tax=Lindgomyces ingoldianus TaxID=673940 RepID=A0ACB6QEW1_9PLEO|nr:uncharacterized protein BDR25DRAFT_360397 [Lindgomyces ingoldianus]KAF2465437.1 hypothetical protein BDR25DRAFT_360397 [Lindgomyces ingoldianus]